MGLNKISRREICRNVFGSIRSLALCSGITLDAFRAKGIIFCSMHKLQLFVKDPTTSGRAGFNIMGLAVSVTIVLFRLCHDDSCVQAVSVTIAVCRSVTIAVCGLCL